ncbi:MAG TPA: hypothetical protein VFU69_18275 [Ktedonobacterales bacterium]|nr:hypothetical protein [Ktedonobacterales bacterium]
MQYARLALSVAWPQLAAGALWLVVALVALYYARATRRPVFLYGGITALLLSLSEVLSPIRLAYRYFTHRVYCGSLDDCAAELQFGAAKFEWGIVALAALLFLAGIYLEVRRARRRAAASNAARAAASQRVMGAAPPEGFTPAGAFAGQYQTASVAQPITSYGYDPAFAEDGAEPAQAPDLTTASEDEQPAFYRRPAPGSGSGSF